jgi:hypothetical protein
MMLGARSNRVRSSSKVILSRFFSQVQVPVFDSSLKNKMAFTLGFAALCCNVLQWCDAMHCVALPCNP